ncbi:MAG: hypothetical protein ACKOEC_18610, partial [Acidimicrobiia bacterium]
VVYVGAPMAVDRQTALAQSPALQPPPQAPPAQPTPPLQVDLAVEVIGDLPVDAKFKHLTQLLARRQATTSAFSRRYAPTILEFIRLVNRNPEQPKGRAWDSIHALTIRYEAQPDHVVVEYCIDACDFDPKTGAFNPRRKMVWYRATSSVVDARLDKKLRELKKFER